MPKSTLKPLLLLNITYLALLITLGPKYGWTVMIIVGAFVSGVNLFAMRATTRPPRS